MTVYLCPLCGRRRALDGGRPKCDRVNRHGSGTGPVPMITDEERGRAVRAELYDGTAPPDDRLLVPPGALSRIVRDGAALEAMRRELSRVRRGDGWRGVARRRLVDVDSP